MTEIEFLLKEIAHLGYAYRGMDDPSIAYEPWPQERIGEFASYRAKRILEIMRSDTPPYSYSFTVLETPAAPTSGI